MPIATRVQDDKFKTNESLPLLFADILRVSRRSDGMILLQFAAATPTEFREQTRVIVPSHAARALIDLLCEMSGHYPEKPVKSPAPDGAKSAAK